MAPHTQGAGPIGGHGQCTGSTAYSPMACRATAPAAFSQGCSEWRHRLPWAGLHMQGMGDVVVRWCIQPGSLLLPVTRNLREAN